MKEASSNPSSKVQQSLFSDFPPPNQLSPPPEALGKERKGLKYLSNGPRPSEEYQALLYSAAIKVPARAIEMYLELREVWKNMLKYGFTEPLSGKLLPDLHPSEQNVLHTPVIDLNETLIYTDWKDLSKLNRDPKKILYVRGNAFDTSLQPENCVPIKSYKLESDDTVLVDLIPFLEYVARNGPADIRPVLASYERKDVAKEFLERSVCRNLILLP
ncbi:hypothetical protein F2Q69_00047160 [Brassica cretica]|uniref:Mitochondrial import inner membrane translocase subunit TIM50 n=1 Tax=Brassica cretica TaxID=69181 RepID=A0A8S9PTZ8_BRACR|nr:hypothetical protein F2Q69_00047160 [Brassica cretica]